MTAKSQTTLPLLQLESFFPYRLTELQLAISDTIAELYTGGELTRHEWRVLLALGEYPNVTAKAVCAHANLDKMQTSRAIAKMVDKSLLRKTADNKDKRTTKLNLSKKGQQLYNELVPVALARETQLLSVLTTDEKWHLNKILDKLLVKARAMPNVGG